MRSSFPIPLPPEIEAKAQQLSLNPEDVSEHFIRGSGHGGQKINKTESTVQLVHHPSGLIARSQRFREQGKNRLDAWKLLILKLEEREKGEESELQKRIFKLRKQKARRTKRAKEKMLREKKATARVKEMRRKVDLP